MIGDALARHGVPGAAVGVLAGGEVTVEAAGVLNLHTRVEATPDSVFQLGSISKVYTATLVVRLAEQGLLDLDAPVRDVLPAFRVADPDVSARVTPRHLLTHTSGIAGDCFADTGRGDDCLERYVAELADVGQDVPFSGVMSYSNTAYVVLGRLVEVLTGQSWDAALRSTLLAPAGLHATVTLPEDALRFRTAWGHVGDPVGPAEGWSAAVRSLGPAGGVCASAADVLAFVRLHLEDPALAIMRAPHVAVPDRWTTGSHWGLGWIVDDWGGHPVFGHDGNTGGQSARLRVVPDAGVALVVLGNGGDVQGLWEELCGTVMGERFGLAVPAWPAPIPEPADATRVVGRYERHGSRLKVDRDGDELIASLSVLEPLASQLGEFAEGETAVVRASDAGPDVFVTRAAGEERWRPLVVFDIDGRRYVHTGARAQPEVST